MTIRALLIATSLTFAISIAAPLAADEPADPAIYGIELSKDDFAHWSFPPIVAVAPPVVERHFEWIRNPIDAFVLPKLHAKGLAPAPQADDRTWLRLSWF